MTPNHQCEEATDSDEQSTVSSKAACSADTGQASVQKMTTDTYDVHSSVWGPGQVHRPRRLNIVKFCDTCDTLHPSGSVCPTCVNGTSPT